MAIKKDYKKLTQQTKKKKQAKNAAQDGFNADKEKRLIRLIRLIRTADGGVLNEASAARECGVSKRTIQRDIKVLSDAGIPLRKKNDLNSNYHLEKEWKIQHYNIDKKNALAFLRAYRALSYFHDNTDELVSPLQKDMLDDIAYKLDSNKDVSGCKNKQKEKHLSQEEFVSLLTLFNTEDAKLQKRILNFLACNCTNYTHTTPDYSIKIYQQLLKLEERSEYYYWMGIAYLELKKYEQAKESFIKAIKADPSDTRSYSELAHLYSKSNNWTEVFNLMKTVLQFKPDNPFLNNDMFSFLMKAGKYEDALKYVPVIRRKIYNQYATYAYVYEQSGDYKKALEYINKAIEAAPDEEQKYLQPKRQRILAFLDPRSRTSIRLKKKVRTQNNNPAQ